MKRLLLVSWQYPPHTGSGVFRPLRFSKRLPDHGWEVTVLSVTERVRTLKDPELAREIPDGVRVVRSATLEPRSLVLALGRLGLGGLALRLQRWWLLPDEQRGWVPFAVRRGARALAAEPHHAILSTSAPYSAHLVARALAQRSGLPWVADFRDEWSLHPDLVARYPTRRHLERNRDLERAVLREASAVISVSAPFLADHRSLVPDEPPEKFHVLTNGYDERHFPEPPAPPPADRFRIAYTGILYGTATARSFLEGMRRALRAGSVDATRTEVVLVGHGNARLDAPELPPGMLRTEGHRPHREVLELLRSAAVLLLVAEPDRGPGLYPGKLFPYLAAGRPVLALAPTDGVSAELIRRSRSGVSVSPSEPSAIAAALGELYEAWSAGRGGLPDQDRELVRSFGAIPQTARLAALLDELAAAP